MVTQTAQKAEAGFMGLLVTTFGSRKEFEEGRAVLDRLSLAYEVLSPVS